MGIQGLTKVIGDYASGSTKENEIKNYFGRKIAVDASMCIYQFLIAVRQDGSMLTNAEGETTRHGLCRAQWAGMMGVVTCSFFAATSWHHSPATELYRRCTSLKAKSHLMGMFYRTIRMIENGIKPCYVFDGKPPDMKSGELAKRKEKRDEAQKELEKAEEADDQENVDKFSKRLVKVTKQHNEECKELLKLMGVPFVDAPCEAEAQCAALVKAGKVYATGTEDMDALTFGSSVLLRHLTFSEARKMPIKEFHVEKILLEMGLSMDEFIDLCILLGCDYCDSIRGIGPKRAVDLIKQYKNIETILKHLDTKKYTVPEDWPYEKARNLFKNPEVTDPEELDLKWAEPDETALVKYMVEDKGFTEDRIRNGCKKLTKAKNTSTQGRLDSFFKVISVTPAAKRKDADQKGSAKKKAKTGGFKKGR